MILEWLKLAVEKKASDIFIASGRSITFKINGVITPQNGEKVTPAEAEQLITGLFDLANKKMDKYIGAGDDDFPVTVPGVARFRVNAYRQRNTMSAVIRVVMFDLPNYKDLRIPEQVMDVAHENNGLVLVTGPAGSGKSTTLACIIDEINKTKNSHIITLEDPIEFIYYDNKSFISQREISSDTTSYMDALRACLRQAPNIILLGEMRDHDTISAAMTAAETGHLVISTLHTVGAANTIDRIIDTFPPGQQQQTRIQLSMVLRSVISQILIPDINHNSIPAFEIMKVNKAVTNIIREAKTHQIDGVIQNSSDEDMISMDAYLLKLYRNGDIEKETALGYASNVEQMQRQISL
ncbi:MAG: PilT/PilU family type 4a pilus ATPase [Oscillospiraceae bacterium]|nr:PilT/PilU family type 4a pilus ATPase [Oscillospiraceae bacterium]